MSEWRIAIRANLGDFELDVDLVGDWTEEGSVLALVGPNGSGKTTLLRAVAGAIEVDRAEIVIGGEILASTSRGVSMPIEKRGVGFVPQGYGLFGHLSVVDNVGFGLSAGSNRLSRRGRRARALAMLEEIECAHLARRFVGGLSGGEAQRVALARALVLDPRVLLLDEPLAALDAITRRSVRRFLARRLAALDRPAVVVTHDVRDVAALKAQVAVLEAGRIIQRGSLEELRRAPESEFVSEFVGAVG